MERNDLQKAMDQIGQDAITRYLPRGMQAINCPLHGHYLVHYSNKDSICPLCVSTGTGEGTTATQIEHWIDLKDQVQATTGYRPQG